MKKIEGSWSMLFTSYPGKDHFVTKYLNHFYKENAGWYSNGTGKYWGVTFVKGIDICICVSNPFGKVLTEQKFLKLTQEMTKEDIENYKDFKKGDILFHKNYFCKVIETLGDIVFIGECTQEISELDLNDGASCYVKESLYTQGWRLYIPIVELTLEDIAKKFEIDVTNLKIKK